MLTRGIEIEGSIIHRTGLFVRSVLYKARMRLLEYLWLFPFICILNHARVPLPFYSRFYLNYKNYNK